MNPKKFSNEDMWKNIYDCAEARWIRPPSEGGRNGGDHETMMMAMKFGTWWHQTAENNL